MYVKLFSSILDSSVWDESPATRLVWITMLCMADEHGFVRGTVASVARRAVVTPEDAERAIQVLESPDPMSHTPDHEGRRIQPVDGGWLVLNYKRYREMRTRKQVKEAEKKRRQREREKEGGTRPACPDVSPPYASPSASDVVVVNSATVEKLDSPAVEPFGSYQAKCGNPAAMEAEVVAVAGDKGWPVVSRAIVEMSIANAKWTPHVLRAFASKVRAPSSGYAPGHANLPDRPPCPPGCALQTVEGQRRPVLVHIEGCPNA